MKTKLLLLLTLVSFWSFAQKEPLKTPSITFSSNAEYGEPITLETARKLAKAAEAYAIEKQWTVVIAIVDTGGNLVLFEKIDNTQIGSIDIAIAKAKTANNFKRSTKVFEDAVTNGGVGLRVLNVPGILPAMKAANRFFSTEKSLVASVSRECNQARMKKWSSRIGCVEIEIANAFKSTNLRLSLGQFSTQFVPRFCLLFQEV